jgi:heme/copper-type cytochrome/quinol oxidase subunit 3
VSALAAAVAVERPELALDPSRGTLGMRLFILTEALLFVLLFFTYFYLARGPQPWPSVMPKLTLALLMLLLLLTSSGLLWLAEHELRRGRHSEARAAVIATIALGCGFLVLQFLEYRERLRSLRPTSDAYGSIFYALTGLHGVHVMLGLAMLAFVALLPDLEGVHPPHRPLHNASLYWHFVDAVWVLIVCVVYVLPNVRA